VTDHTGSGTAPGPDDRIGEDAEDPTTQEVAPVTIDLGREYDEAGIAEVLDALDRDLVGLAPVKLRVREIAALLLVERVRERMGLSAGAPSLHMCFTGNPGTGKTTVAMRMAEILHRLGYCRKGHVVAVTRDDLVGQYIGHTAPKTKDVLKRAMGGVLFIDEAYYLHRPENEKDYGQEAIEILLQVMENQRDDLVVILAGYEDRMNTFFESNPGMASRIAHHVSFPDYTQDELFEIAEKMLGEWNYHFDPAAAAAFREYLEVRRNRPHFANARSVRNALDRIRLRQALRLFEERGRQLTPEDLQTIHEPEVRASRLFDTDCDENETGDDDPVGGLK
jgi:probable Rubsico expression protein CbbX